MLFCSVQTTYLIRTRFLMPILARPPLLPELRPVFIVGHDMWAELSYWLDSFYILEISVVDNIAVQRLRWRRAASWDWPHSAECFCRHGWRGCLTFSVSSPTYFFGVSESADMLLDWLCALKLIMCHYTSNHLTSERFPTQSSPTSGWDIATCLTSSATLPRVSVNYWQICHVISRVIFC